MKRNLPALLVATALAVLIVLAWFAANPAVDPPGGVPGQRFQSLSFTAYRPGESPLTETFPTEAEADSDLALLAGETEAIRTYSALEGGFDVAALAQKHGLKLWQGIWLGADRAKNNAEIAKAIDLARLFPATITRVIVGNEVLLRRDLPLAELEADIDRVRSAVKQPVAYADVQEFWQQFPEVAQHVDVILVHLLPYWEDTPYSVNNAIGHISDVYVHMQTLFPGKPIVIGETGWPSRGRERADAVPGRVEQTAFLRGFLAWARKAKAEYNFIEAFDQDWKYASEGIVGANWGLFTANRQVKIPLAGPVVEDPAWPWHAALSLVAGAGLTALGLLGGTRASRKRRAEIAGAGMLMGAAWGWAAAGVDGAVYDVHLTAAGLVNLTAQAVLACLLIWRMAGHVAPLPWRPAAAAARTLRGLLGAGGLPPLAGMLEDMVTLFAVTALILQALLVVDGRYREFPVSSFAVPCVVTGVRAWLGDLRRGDPRREEYALAVLLPLLGVTGACVEGYLNLQSLLWLQCVLILAVPFIWRCVPRDAAA